MFKESTNIFPSQQNIYAWNNLLAKSALFLFGIALWQKGLSFYTYSFSHYLLLLAWFLDGGLSKLRIMIKEPFVTAILILCSIMALGILWSDDPNHGFRTWRRYSAFLIFIPYLALLNKNRLHWAIGGILIGYSLVLAMGIYQRFILNAQGISPLGLPYLHFSSMLGIGFLSTLYLSGIMNNNKIKLSLYFLSIFLLFVQFHQDARGILIATIISSIVLISLMYIKKLKVFFAAIAIFFILSSIFAYSSSNFQERTMQAKSNIESLRSGNYDTSLGLRLAWWDVGLHGISERPLLGHGTGMAVNYFNKSAETYKNGLYKNLKKLVHYHNDWIEIGMHIGALGLITYAYLLWGWFQILKSHQLSIPGATLICFVFLCGITDLLVFFRQIIYLLLVITAIGICWHKAQKINSMPTSLQKN
ncbi:MAG: ligase [Nitrosomonadaceae bacterium]|nr:ligase [Nitrosomonadaceae bacterium]|tara:strand:+ start:5186 stop:6439 length:1254 start_codon:yes stop_codon:yes gene_type:complete